MVNNTIVNNLANAIINKISSMISGKEDSSNKVSSWTNPPNLNNTKYAGEKLVKDTLDTKLDISQGSGYNGYYMKVNSSGNVAPENVNFKTINNESILGTGNIEIGSDDVGTFDDLYDLINNASSGDTITLTKDYICDVNDNYKGLYINNKNLTINGNGHIIDGQAFYNNKYISGEYFANTDGILGIITANVTLKNIIFKNGFANGDNDLGGGAIWIEPSNDCEINIYNCIFLNNGTAVDGGAIKIENNYSDDISLSIINCLFERNYTLLEWGGECYGSAISIVDGGHISLNVLIDSCVFNDNYSEKNLGTIYEDYSVTTITNCIFNGLQSREINIQGTLGNGNKFLNSKVDVENGANQMTDSSAYSNIGTSANATQKQINTGINNVIGNKVNKSDVVGTFTDLQTIINDTSSGGTIVLNKDYKYDSTTDSSLTDGIIINKNITIVGNGHIIDGNNNQRGFYISDGTSELLDLKIQNCKHQSGGGILITNYANLTIIDSTLNNNTTNLGYGGAIANVNENSSLIIINTTLTKNKAQTTGGAIFNLGTLNIKESIIKNNTANSIANIMSPSNTVIAYNCEINDISTTCQNVTNITIESLVNMIGDAITYINMGDAINYIVGSGE